MEPLEDVPWVLVGVAPQTGPETMYVAHCQVCGASAGGPEHLVNDFADAHAVHESGSQTHYGAGDLVARLAKSLGFTKPCTPCEARRQAMNAAVPRVPFFRR